MDWLKRLLGDGYNVLNNETIELLKKAFGDKEWIQNDPTKIIPKHVFNEKLEEIKLLKAQEASYKEQLKTVENMITKQENLTSLATMKLEFESKMKEQQQQHEKQLNEERMTNSLKQELLSNGLNPNYVDMMVNSINKDDVVFKDGKILNSEKLILPLKETFKESFTTKITSNPLPGSSGNNPEPKPTSRQDLITKYNEAEKRNDMISMLSLQRQIKNIKEE